MNSCSTGHHASRPAPTEPGSFQIGWIAVLLLVSLVGPWGLKRASGQPAEPVSSETETAGGSQLDDTKARGSDHPSLSALRSLLAAHPEDDEIRGRLARALAVNGHWDEAIDLYRAILARHPHDVDIRLALARTLGWAHRFAEARAEVDEVLAHQANHLEAREVRADLAWWSGQAAQALRWYDELLQEGAGQDVRDKRDKVAAQLALAVSPKAPVGPMPEEIALPFRRYVKLGYGGFGYTRQLPQEHNVLAEVAYPWGAATLIGRYEHLRRFGLVDDQFSAEAYRPLWNRAWGYVGASGVPGADFAPSWSVGGELFQGLGAVSETVGFLEPSFGYRRMVFRSGDTVDLLIPGTNIYLPASVWLTEKIYYVADTGAITLSSQLSWRPTARWQAFVSYAFGTSGERIVATQDLVRVRTWSVQGGATMPLAARLSAELTGFHEDRATLYRRTGALVSLIVHY
ncbi:MAG: YaiO family outer membrane beta-barrel protein [candidate division KSB1 bacterium]|nr:YaiO family outer membrane beta-barrel protein [candidate division KSB1 bacterium]